MEAQSQVKAVYLFLMIIFFSGMGNAETEKPGEEEKIKGEEILWSEEKPEIALDPIEEDEFGNLANLEEAAYKERETKDYKDTDKFSNKEKIMEQQLKKDAKTLEEK